MKNAAQSNARVRGLRCMEPPLKWLRVKQLAVEAEKQRE